MIKFGFEMLGLERAMFLSGSPTKGHRDAIRKVAWTTALLVLACWVGLGSLSAEQPLSKDDMTLLLVGGATTERLISLIEQRGVDFQMGPDLTKRFRDLGASEAVLETLGKAAAKPKAPPAAPSAASGSAPTSVGVQASPNVTNSSEVQTQPKRGADLGDPNPERIQEIIREFARQERLFKEARNNYSYHQVNKVEEVNVDGKVVGTYEQDWDVLYDDSGKRVEHVTYSPASTLRGLMVNAEDLDAMRSIQPFVLTTDELPDYKVAYLGHVKLDEITAYVFSVHPKELKKGRLYFQGTVWVDDRDLQVVKSDGKTVPEARPQKGQFNLFPRFTTFREQIDGKYWFPTYTMADDTLYFLGGPTHVKEIIRYAEYKQFKASSNFRIVPEQPADQSKAPLSNPPSKP